MQHEFAKFWLKEKGRSIYIGEKQILKYQYDEDSYRQYSTMMKSQTPWLTRAADHEASNEENIRVIGLADLKRMGYIVATAPVSKKLKWRKNQRVIWYLCPTGQGAEITSRAFTALNAQLEYDFIKRRVRGRGKEFGSLDGKYKEVTEWIELEQKHTDPNALYQSYDDIRMAQIRQLQGYDIGAIKEKINVKEAIVMVTESRQLLGLLKERDMQGIGLVSKTGKGKTTALSNIVSQVKNQFNDNAAIFDPLGIFGAWMEPNNFFKQMLAQYGMVPKGMQSLNLHLACPEVEFFYPDEGVDFLYVVSFLNFLKRFGYFSYKIRKWDLGKAQRYLDEFYASFSKATTSAEIATIMEEVLVEENVEKKKGEDAYKNMIKKWKPTFNNIFSAKFTDNMYQDDENVGAEWKLKMENGEILEANPMIVCAEAGLVPVLNMEKAKWRNYYRNVVADIQNSFIRWQTKRGNLRKRLWLAFDELQAIYELGRDKDNAEEAQEDLYRQRRNLSIGAVYNTQSYDKLHEDIRKNTTHLFCGTIQTQSERNLIAKDYSLSKTERDALGDLGKFEFMAMSRQDDRWVLYEPDGERKVVDKGIFRGQIFPPIAKHAPPLANSAA